MDERINFKFNIDDVVARATTILRDAYREGYGSVPALSLCLPEDFNSSREYSHTLIILMKGVQSAMVQIFQQTRSDMNVEEIQMSLDDFRITLWRVFVGLKMTPIYDKYITGGINGKPLIEREKVYEGFTLPPNYGEMGNVGTTRTLDLVWEQRQAEYLSSIQSMNELLYQRWSLLEEFFDEKTRRDRENISSHIEKCSLELDLLRRDFIHFCEKYGFENTVTPAPKDEPSEHEKAVHWNDFHHQEEALESFAPSRSETSLLPYMSKNFQQYESYLFHFTFDTSDEIDEMGCDPEQVFGQDKRRMLERQYVRKMLIAYHARFELMLAKSGRGNLGESDIFMIKQSLPILKKEIEECRRKLASRAIAPTEEATEEGKLVTHDIGEIGTLAGAVENILLKTDIMRTPPEVLKILERISETLHTFFSSSLTIRTDGDLEDCDKESIIQTFRDEALEKIRSIQIDMGSLEVDDENLDKAERILMQARQHFMQY